MDCLQLLVLKNSSTKTPSRTPLTCTSDHSACFLLYLLLVCKLSRRTLLNPPKHWCALKSSSRCKPWHNTFQAVHWFQHFFEKRDRFFFLFPSLKVSFSAFHSCFLSSGRVRWLDKFHHFQFLLVVSLTLTAICFSFFFFFLQHTFGKCAVLKTQKFSFHIKRVIHLLMQSFRNLPGLPFAVNDCPVHLLLVKQQQFRERNPSLYYIWPVCFINWSTCNSL